MAGVWSFVCFCIHFTLNTYTIIRNRSNSIIYFSSLLFPQIILRLWSIGNVLECKLCVHRIYCNINSKSRLWNIALRYWRATFHRGRRYPLYPVGTDPPAQISGTVLSVGQSLHGDHFCHHILLHVQWTARDQWTSTVFVMGPIATVLQHRHLLDGRYWRCDAGRKYHEETATFSWLPRCVEHGYDHNSRFVRCHWILRLCPIWWECGSHRNT